MARSDGPQPRIATAITDISERTTLLVREEIELAKAEVSDKAGKIGKGVAVATIAGFFALIALLFVFHGVAWGLWNWFFDEGTEGNDVFWGYFIVAGALFLLAGIAALIGLRWLKSGAPPSPDLAIDEAKRIKETFTGGADPATGAVGPLVPSSEERERAHEEERKRQVEERAKEPDAPPASKWAGAGERKEPTDEPADVTAVAEATGTAGEQTLPEADRKEEQS